MNWFAWRKQEVDIHTPSCFVRVLCCFGVFFFFFSLSWELNRATVFFVRAVRLFFMIQIDVWMPLSQQRWAWPVWARFQSIFLFVCWKKEKLWSSVATQVSYRFLSVLIHTSFMCFISVLTCLFWDFNYVSASCFPSDWGTSVPFGIVWGFFLIL